VCVCLLVARVRLWDVQFEVRGCKNDDDDDDIDSGGSDIIKLSG